tara:strand:- start:4671 stop:4904 length:234 start_codon:yes stop_codon:yes gene_type:complete
MAKKYIVKEGILTKFVSALTQNIIDKKRAKNQKALKNDPVLRKMEDKLAKDIQDFQDYVEKKTGRSNDEFLKMLGRK